MLGRRTILLLCALFALLPTAALLSACGGSGDDDVSTVLAQTFGSDKQIKSGRLQLTLGIDAQGLASVNGPVNVRLSGPFQSAAPGQLPRFAFDLALDGGGQALAAGAVSTGDKGFVRYQGQAYALTDQLFQQFRNGYVAQSRCANQRDAKGGLSLQSLGIDPRRWLVDPKDQGVEDDVGGVKARHISAGIDVPKFLDDVNRVLARTRGQGDPCATGAGGQQGAPQELTAAQRQQIVDAVKGASVQVWSGEDDRTLRRLNVELRLQGAQGQQGAGSGAPRSGTVRFDLLLGALNQPQQIAAPADAQPLSALTQRLGGTLPGIGGAGAGGTGGGGATAPGASQYQQCVDQAGQDVQALQRCADLAGR